MKKIKFRAWCVIDGEGSFIHYSLSERNSFNFEILDQEEINQQFTGLLDSKGKDIYEGDVLSYGNLFPNCEVVFDDSVGAFKTKIYGAGTLEGQVLTVSKFTKKDLENFYIIGNIFENPELLK